MGIESYLLASSLRLVIAQRLVRRLCQNCKEPVETSYAIKEKFHLSSNAITFKGVGCSDCNQSGFKGRIALTEAISITDQLKKMIHDDASESDLTKEAFANTDSIQSSSTELLIQGITSFQELLKLQNHNDVDL